MVRAFNARMATAGKNGFLENPVPDWLPPVADSPTHRELFVALGEDDQAHGGYVLRWERALVGGAERDIASVQGPYSEGAADPRHARTSFALIKDMMRRNPRLYGWGMESRPEMLDLFGMFRWRSVSSPTLAWWGLPLLSPGRRAPAGARTTEEPDFGDWADALWHRWAREYSFVAARDTATMRAVYPPGDSAYHRLVVRRDGEVIGWAVTGIRRFRGHPKFRSLCVGAVWDAFAAPADAGDVLAAAQSWLARAGAVVIVASFSDLRWSAALRRRGFRPRGRNRHFLMSPTLADEVEKAGPEQVFLTFGDAEGPSGVLGQELFPIDRNV